MSGACRDRVRFGSFDAVRATAATAAAAAADGKDESITNTQHAGVDEGGIVEVHGDHLVVLRRGRLFTVKVGDDSLTPIAHVDAFGPDVAPRGAWYDEMLVSGDTSSSSATATSVEARRSRSSTSIAAVESPTAPLTTCAPTTTTLRATTRAA